MSAFAPATNQEAVSADITSLRNLTSFVAFKAEFLGRWITESPNYIATRITRFEKSAMEFGILTGDAGEFTFWLNDSNNGSLFSSNQLKVNYDPDEWYTAYYEFSSSGRFCEVISEAGAQILTFSSAGSVPFPITPGTGVLRAGSSLNAFARPISGVAAYSAPITGTPNRWAVPTAADPNILSYQPFNEGAGTTAADAIVANGNWALSSALWTAGGRFNSSPPAGNNGYARPDNIFFFWRKKFL